MLWAPQNPGNACPAPDLCLHLAKLMDNRDSSTMPLSRKSAKLGAESGFRTAHTGLLGKEGCCGNIRTLLVEVTAQMAYEHEKPV